MSLVVKRLGEALARAPKSGYKASIYTGVVSKLISMAENALRAAELAQCIGLSKESCRKRDDTVICDPDCANIFLVSRGEERSILKVGSNAIGVSISGSRVEIKSKGAGIVLEPGKAVILLPAGDKWVPNEIDLTDIDDVVRKVYFIKYAVRKVDTRLEVTLRDLTSCSRRSGLTC
jgi:hypothetical protein